MHREDRYDSTGPVPRTQLPQGDTVRTMRLTPAEYRALRLIGSGLSYGEVAAWEGVTFHTAKRHITDSYARLGVSTAIEAFITLGWLQVPGVEYE